MSPDPLVAVLTARRKALGLSQAAVAKQLGLMPNAVCQWESGNRTPRVHRFAAWAAVLGMRVELTDSPAR